MKDSDEGAAVKYTVDVIYLLMERTHHTDTLSFKFSLSKHEPNIDQDHKRTFTCPCGSHMNEHTQIHANKHTVTLSLHLSPITLPIPWRQKPKQRQLGTRLINHIIIPHAFLCDLMNYWWAAMSRVSYSCEVFARECCICQKNKPNDVRCHPWPL